jgi:hypothetical protein
MLLVLDKGSVVDPHLPDLPTNYTTIVLKGFIMVMGWRYSFAGQFPGRPFDVCSDNHKCREFLEKGTFPSILQVGKGGALIVRSGSFTSLVAQEHSGIVNHTPIPELAQNLPRLSISSASNWVE